MYLHHQAYTLYYRHVCILVFMYLRFPCYCDACLNSSDLRVGLKTLLNKTITNWRLKKVTRSDDFPESLESYKRGRTGTFVFWGKNFRFARIFTPLYTQSWTGKFAGRWFCSLARTFLNVSRIWGDNFSPVSYANDTKVLACFEIFLKGLQLLGNLQLLCIFLSCYKGAIF